MGATSEVGRLRTVMLHRPGPELRRLTPRNNDQLLFDGVPWVARAQEEHDAFAEALTDARRRGAAPRPAAGRDPVLPLRAGRADRRRRRRPAARRHPAARGDHAPGLALAPRTSPATLIAGLAHDELRGGTGLAYEVMDRGDFVVPPLPNLLFTRDSSVWVGDEVAVTSLAMPARHRESTITAAVYTHHPRFAGVEQLYGSAAGAPRGRRRPAAGRGRGGGRGRRADDARRRGAAGPAACSPAGWRTRCSSSPSPSSGRRCTWTPSRRWSTSTRWSCTPPSPTR